MMLRALCAALLVVMAAMSAPATAAFTPPHLVPAAQTIPGPGYTPEQVESVYQIAPLRAAGLDGAGQTIAFIEIDNLDPKNIGVFDHDLALPDASIREFWVGGKPFKQHTASETALDVEWAHALAPGAALQIYHVPITGWDWEVQLGRAIDLAVANGATVLSDSLISCAVGKPALILRFRAPIMQALARAAKRGVSTFVASGDWGDHPGPGPICGKVRGVGYPASDPSVVSVGGTNTYITSDGVLEEGAWQGSGGGNAKPMPRPSWQVAPTLRPGKYRYAPDVAFIGNPRNGVGFVYRGIWGESGGTSLGAPAWAAIWSLILQDAKQAGKTLGAAGPLIYQIGNSPAYSQAFHDVTAGNNGHYQAGPGWDAVTGWGTPNAAGLAAAALAISPSPSQDVVVRRWAG